MFLISQVFFSYVTVVMFRVTRQLRLLNNFSRKMAYIKKGVIV